MSKKRRSKITSPMVQAGPIKRDTPAFRLMKQIAKEIVDDVIRRNEAERVARVEGEPRSKSPA